MPKDGAKARVDLDRAPCSPRWPQGPAVDAGEHEARHLLRHGGMGNRPTPVDRSPPLGPPIRWLAVWPGPLAPNGSAYRWLRFGTVETCYVGGGDEAIGAHRHNSCSIVA